MKLLDYLTRAGLIAQTSASFEAHIYLSNSEQSNKPHPPSLSPNTARLLLAQRLGLAEYHALGNLGESELSILNDYGGPQKALFPPQSKSEGELLILEGILHPGDSVGSDRTADILVNSPPQSSATRKLASDLLGQKDHQQNDAVEHIAPIKYISSLQDLPRDDPNYATLLHELKLLIDSHLSSPGNTLLITPPFSHTSASATYGSYTPPHALSRREQAGDEAVLSSPNSASAAEDSPSSSSSNTATSAASSNPTASFSPLPRGPLPLCHPTLDTLIASTRNCSGHGTPYKQGSAGGDEEAPTDCYACKCHDTQSVDASGVKRVHKWGGPACQKQDVSSPFWLLAGLTVFLVMVTSWGISLLVGIGGEELPGVIGAGVAGPRAQK